MLRRTSRLLVALMAAAVLSAAAAQVELTYWHGFTGPDMPLMEQLIA